MATAHLVKGSYNARMDAVGRQSDPASPAAAPGYPPAPWPGQPRTPPHGGSAVADKSQGELGTSSGVNISPGSDDDGWKVPPPVKLSDGTVVQLYKDGEALH